MWSRNHRIYSIFTSSTFLDYIQPTSILGTALEGPYVLCKELLFSQMNRISILWLQVSMTIKTKHSSAPTWYLMANAAAAYNSSIFIPTLFCRTETIFLQRNWIVFTVIFPLPLELNTNNQMCYTSPILKSTTLLKHMPIQWKVSEFC